MKVLNTHQYKHLSNWETPGHDWEAVRSERNSVTGQRPCEIWDAASGARESGLSQEKGRGEKKQQ